MIIVSGGGDGPAAAGFNCKFPDSVMLDLAKHTVNQNTSTFEPEKFKDHYEAALTQLINQKRSGKPIEGAAKVRKRSRPDGCPETQHRGAEPAKGKKPRKAAAGQKEMLLPISGKRAAKLKQRKTSLRRREPGNEHDRRTSQRDKYDRPLIVDPIATFAGDALSKAVRNAFIPSDEDDSFDVRRAQRH